MKNVIPTQKNTYLVPRRLVLEAIFFFLLFPLNAFAAEGTNFSPEPWYKIATGVIGIPAALLGLAGAYWLVRKTNLEVKKLELEIMDKQQPPPDYTTRPATAASDALSPPVSYYRILVIILRYVVLNLALQLWGLVPAIIGYCSQAIFYVALLLAGEKAGQALQPWSPTGAVLIIGPQILNILFALVRWFLIVGLGWPLLKDACHLFGISISSFFDIPRLVRRKKRNA